MTITTTREQRRQLARDNAKLPIRLARVSPERWPDCSRMTKCPVAVWRSREFLVQQFDEGNVDGREIMRLTVARSEMGANGRWKDDIAWEDLQQIKRQCGFGDHYAVEVFPRDIDIVNVANMRHLWVVSQPLHIGWFSDRPL